jgi:hypothetical protein
MKPLHIIGETLDTPTTFVRAYSISDVHHDPGLAFDREIFKMPIFLAGLILGGGSVVLDGEAWPEPALALLEAGFFDTSAFHFLLATCEASEPGRGWGAYDTPICSRTQFKRPVFRIIAILRVSYSLGPKLPTTLSASISISAKT